MGSRSKGVTLSLGGKFGLVPLGTGHVILQRISIRVKGTGRIYQSLVKGGPKRMQIPRHFQLSTHTGKVGFSNLRSILGCWLLERKQEGSHCTQAW